MGQPDFTLFDMGAMMHPYPQKNVFDHCVQKEEAETLWLLISIYGEAK